MNGEIRVHHLDRNRAVKSRVRRQENEAHAATPQLPLEAVLSTQRSLQPGDEFSGLNCHGITS
jgi:hypothetical protein